MNVRTGVVVGGLATWALAWVGCSASKPTPVTLPDAPVISCPESQTLQSLDGSPMNVTYGAATTTKGKPPVTTTCSPGSDTTFPIGETTITCSATDAAQRAAMCTFSVTVLAPAKLTVTRFVAFGDSLTAGEDGQNSLLPLPRSYQTILLPQGQRYPSVLESQLKGRYTTQSPIVDPAGVPGESVSDPATRVRFFTALGGHDVVLLMEGSNDMAGAAGDSLIEPGAIAALRQMLRDAKGRGVRPYLATVPPENPNGSRGVAAKFIPGFNDDIRTLAQSEGVPLVDVYEALNADINTFIGFDGLHPTAEGYAKIADVFFAKIKETLEEQAPSSSLRGLPASSATPGIRPILDKAKLHVR